MHGNLVRQSKFFKSQSPHIIMHNDDEDSIIEERKKKIPNNPITLPIKMIKVSHTDSYVERNYNILTTF
jgi:hypothetical protein